MELFDTLKLILIKLFFIYFFVINFRFKSKIDNQIQKKNFNNKFYFVFVFVLKVIAFICGIVVIFLMTLCIASSNWLTADKYRQGLWEFCLDEGAAQPLPFDLNVEPGCYPGRDVGKFLIIFNH